MSLDGEMIRLRDEALADGRVINAMYYGALIIPWGSDCCHGCEYYECGRSITAHGFCPIHRRYVSPHYFCEHWEQD